MAADLLFNEEEMVVDEGLGYPRAYARLCKDRSFGPYSHGPPFTFTPYALHKHEASRAKDLDEMFPIIDPKAKPTTKPKIFVSLLWKQLNHLGNAGFDPATFRVDTYGNVLYYHADSASPLAWDIDHWFPCSRGGLTVPSNLRILQWQVCKKKHNKLEFLIPWWDLQVGISVNQFLSIFASSNSDFRRRAFFLLFSDGESEELNASQTVDSHTFPQHFVESKELSGLAPAAVVVSRRESYDSSSTLKCLGSNRRPQGNTPIIAARNSKGKMSKENEDPNMVSNPYQAIVMARDSLRQREERVKMQSEIERLDDEVLELKEKTEDERASIQDLELVLIKRKRRVEKCRRLAEAQSSYRAMLEKMIRDAMHQSVMYKEQLRLNQAASNALMARLEAQKAICDSSERELHKKFKQRDELEKQIRPEWEQARKRSRMDDSLLENRDDRLILYDSLLGKKDDRTVLYLPGNKPRTHLERKLDGTSSIEDKQDENALYLPGIKSGTPLHKELRVFLEEEQKASEAGLSLDELQEEVDEGADISKKKLEERITAAVVTQEEKCIEEKLQKLKIGEEGQVNIQFPAMREPEEEDEESRKERGKGNVEKWLQMLLEDDTQEGADQNLQVVGETSRTDELIRKMDLIYPQKEIKNFRFPESQDKKEVRSDQEVNKQQTVQEKDGGKHKPDADTEAGNKLSKNQQKVYEENGRKAREEYSETESRDTLSKNPPYRLIPEKGTRNEAGCNGKGVGSSSSFEGKERGRKSEKERGLVRCESARTFRLTPSSPSILVGMRKGVDCIGKKPLVIGDDDGDEDRAAGNNFMRSSIKSIKKAMKI
ncbi:hypothetical protein RJ640_021200 [Escallonia rubra]|uniref:Trichohyalin n=1 Tax=Escallonia rubra TaxID=112253 RepID=A0AA88QP18_9ASTE|nr:hypothetical protein RJ640_021200 [Escallonia rubra]